MLVAWLEMYKLPNLVPRLHSPAFYRIASFPDSIPQLFIALCDKKLGSGVWKRGYKLFCFAFLWAARKAVIEV